MKNEKSRKETKKILFAQYPAQKSFHMTSDDQAFFQKGDAQNHAKTLADKEVEEVFKNASLLSEDIAPINTDTLKAIANGAGVTDETGNLIPGDQASKSDASATAPKVDTKAAKNTAKAPAKAAAPKTAKAVVKKEVAKEEIKPVVKEKDAVVDAAGGTDAK